MLADLLTEALQKYVRNLTQIRQCRKYFVLGRIPSKYTANAVYYTEYRPVLIRQ